MTINNQFKIQNIILINSIVLIIISLSGCGIFSRLSDIGKIPKVTEIENPIKNKNYRPITMPMPAPSTEIRTTNSLWLSGSRAFFKDLRASQIGDILTVVINVADSAQIDNESSRSRTNSENAGIGVLGGLEGTISSILPGNPGTDPLLSTNSELANKGSGSISRKENIVLKIAAVVTQLLPNNNLVIIGRQEFRINNEVRELQIAGIIRPQDINQENTISYEKIAEARVSYGGRGHITDMQMPRYGSQVIDILLPF